MEKTIRWFALGIGALFGATIGALASAAPGDLIYRTGGAHVEITAGQAANAGQWAIDSGIWNGDKADIIRVCAFRDPSSNSGFSAIAVGLKTSTPANLPVSDDPVTVVGIVE